MTHPHENDQPTTMAATAAMQQASPTLQELATTLNQPLPQELIPFLNAHGIHTLADIRTVGGVSQLQGLPAAAANGVASMLDAQANLSVLSPDVQFNSALIAKGFTSPAALAATSLKDFVSAVGDQVGDLRAAQAHVMARAQTHFLNNVLTDMRTSAANGFTAPNDLATLSNQIVQNDCGCADCASATSPLAYLSDLLKYTQDNLKRYNKGINLQFLIDTFHQPFADLEVSCSAEEKQVRQVRICIEILRSYLQSPEQQNNLNAAVSAYLLAAYSALLIRVGTSYDEIRLARSDKPAKRQALADRLSITLGSSRPDHLDALFLDPKTITEENLEELFDLADTTRNPLSDGAKRGDPSKVIMRWNLDGVKWGRNTDPDGVIYVNIKILENGQTVAEVDLFSEPQKTRMVATGKGIIEGGTATINVLEANNSGLSGRIDVDTRGSNQTVITSIELQAVPRFQSWRLQYLRTLWEEEDRPTDAYSEGTASSGTGGRLSLLKVKAPLPS